jgi:hypothetical protein
MSTTRKARMRVTDRNFVAKRNEQDSASSLPTILPHTPHSQVGYTESILYPTYLQAIP